MNFNKFLLTIPVIVGLIAGVAGAECRNQIQEYY